MDLDDLFNMTDNEHELPLKMTINQFISETRKTLKEIENSYGHCWQNRYPATEKEHDKLDEIIKEGVDTVEIDGKEISCVVNSEDGELMLREFDSELFYELVENIMFHDEKYLFYELLECEIINEKTKK